MMRKIPWMVVAVVAAPLWLVSMGCQPQPEKPSTDDEFLFARSRIAEYNLTPPETRRLQIYVSYPLQLRAGLTSDNQETDRG